MSGMDALLAQARAAHEGLMEAAGDWVRIHRPGPPVFDQTTGATVPGTDLVLYNGPGRAKAVSLATGTEVQAGQQELRLRQYEVAIPWGASVPPGQVIQPGDQVTFVTAADPHLVGTTLHVTGRQFGSLASAWRIYAEDREAGAT